MIEVFIDCETTGINPYTAEIIEAYLIRLDTNESYYYRARPLFWSYEAEQIHRITYHDAMQYPTKHKSLNRLIEWLPNNFKFISYVNKNNELGHYNFDVACLENELNLVGYPFYYLKNNKGYKGNVSVLDVVRYAVKNNLMTAPNGDKGRVTYKQEAIYKHLFGESYEAHNCKADVIAMLRIYNHVVKLLDENRDIFTWNKTNNT